MGRRIAVVVAGISIPISVLAPGAATPATSLSAPLPMVLAAPSPDLASLRNRAAALLDNGDDEKAIEIFRDVVKRLPDSAPDRINLAIALIGHNDLDGAEAELRKALEIDPKDPRARYNLGLVLKRKGKNDEAASQLAAVAAFPEGQRDVSVHYNLGIVYKRLRKSDQALEEFRKAVEIRPEHVSAHFQIYNELVQRGDRAKAQPELELFKLLQKATPDFQRTEAYLERGLFTRIDAPGPPPQGGSAATPAGERAEIRFERRSGGGGGPAAEGGGAGKAGAGNQAGRAGTGAIGNQSGGGNQGNQEDSPAAPSGAVGDFDGDGSLDIVMIGAAGPLRVFRQKPAGVFTSVLATVDLRRSISAVAPALAAADVDNDGDTDLLVVDSSGVRLLLNDGKGRLTDATKGSGLESAGGATDALWVDVDRDGDLDLVLAGSSADNGSPPRLYLNAGLYPAAGTGAGAAGDATAATGAAAKTREGKGAAAGTGAGAAAHEGNGEAGRVKESAARPAGVKSSTPAVAGKSNLAAGAPPRFIAAGPEAALPSCGDSLAFADFRGRDDPDLAFLCADGTLSIARNLRAGRFQAEKLVPPVAQGGEGGGGRGSGGGGRGGAGGGWTFPDGGKSERGGAGNASRAAGGTSGAPGTADRVEMRAGDLDGDGWIDLVVLLRGTLFVLWNDGNGSFRDRPQRAIDLTQSSWRTPSHTANIDGLDRGGDGVLGGPASGLALLDADGDGLLDIATIIPNATHPMEPGGLLVLAGERANPAGRPGRSFHDSVQDLMGVGVPAGPAKLLAGDLDGDGDPDLAAIVSSLPQGSTSSRSSTSASPSSTVLSGSVLSASSGSANSESTRSESARFGSARPGSTRFASAQLGVARPGSAPLDSSASGSPAISSPAPIVLTNVTKTSNRFMKIFLSGGKSNKAGIGAKIEVRAERLVVKREKDGNPIIIGIGPRGRADAVQVVWTSGVSQDLVDVPAGVLKIEEKREFAGSCPFLYAWDGSTFRFIGEALSGAPIGFLRPDGEYEKPRPTEHLRLPQGLPVARDGRLSLRMTEEMRELTALDSVRLVAVDHPVGTEVYSNERLREAEEPFRYVVLDDLRSPRAMEEVLLGEGELEAIAAGSSREQGPARSDRMGRGGVASNALTASENAGALLQLDGIAAAGFRTLGPRLEGLAESHAVLMRFDSDVHAAAHQISTLSRVIAAESKDDVLARLDLERRPDQHQGLYQQKLDGPTDTTDAKTRAAARASGQSALVIDGWVGWMTSDVSRALLQAKVAAMGREPMTQADEGMKTAAASRMSAAIGGRESTSEPPAVEMPSFAGRPLPGGLEIWGPALEVTVGDRTIFEPDLGLPIGPSMVAPLPDDHGEGPVEVRIGSNLAVYYDRIRLGRIVDAAVTVRELRPVSAELRWRGVAASRRHEDTEPTRSDYDDVSPISPFRRLAEDTTAPGDVLPLVLGSDERFAIFGTGDEIALEFDAHAIPPPDQGYERTWFLVSTGYARDGDPNTEPLPWGK